MKTLIVAFFISILSFNVVAEPAAVEWTPEKRREALYGFLNSRTNEQLKLISQNPSIASFSPTDEERILYWDVYRIITNGIGPLSPNLRLHSLKNLMWIERDNIEMIHDEEDPDQKQELINSLVENGNLFWNAKLDYMCEDMP